MMKNQLRIRSLLFMLVVTSTTICQKVTAFQIIQQNGKSTRGISSFVVQTTTRTAISGLRQQLCIDNDSNIFTSTCTHSKSTMLTMSATDSSSSTSSTTNSNILYPMKRGTTVALVTPFDEYTGHILYDELRSLLQYHIVSGTDNLCILGTTGEAAVLDDEEITKVLQIAVEEVKGKMTILVGTGTINTNTVKSNTIRAADLGCDAALVVTPYYVKPPQRGLINHFTSIADLSNGLPVIVYNVPGRTGVNIDDTSIVTCAQHNNIIGLKDATGNIPRHIQLQQLLKESTSVQNRNNKFLLYSGDDGTTVDYVSQGGDGCISVTCNVAAKLMHDIVHLALSSNTNDNSDTTTYTNNIQKAQLLNKQYLDNLHNNLFIESNPIPTKYAMKKIGLLSSNYARQPLCTLDPQYETIIDTALRTAQLLV